MVGSSELRTRLGEDRADELRRDHDGLLASAVADHGGAVLRWTGDGLKAAFASASAAVAAAIDMQRAVVRYGRSADAVAPFQMRVGISVGEVTDEDGDLHGVAVIEGARLEALAAPGEILVSDLVLRLGQRRLDVDFEEVGSRTLKGLDQPVTVFRVIDTAGAADRRPVPRAVAVDRRFPMVGRADDLAVAAGLWGEVQAGRSATVLVAGQPGIGKSRFIAQVADVAHADGALVLAGVCDSDLAVPYQPFAMAFGEVPTRDGDLGRALEDGLGPLGPLFPARRGGRFEDAGPSARFELFEAVVALVERLAQDQPVVLALEDLQWATPPTVQLLRHLVRRSSPTRLLLLASYRVDDVGTSHPLHDLLAEIHGSNSVAKVELTALRRADVAELVTDRVPGASVEMVDDFSGRLYDESGGSPFFVCELLDHLSTTGELGNLVGTRSGSELPIPDSVRDVVGQRLGRLPEGAAGLLTSAAVIGQTFDLALLAELAGRSLEEVLGVLEEVERVALVREVDAGRFAFAHAIVRTTLLDGMSASRRALAHRRVAEAIEAVRPADHDELAHHWLLAGVDDKAYVNLELAARRDLEALAYESAIERYQAVLDHHRATPVGDTLATARAWLGVGLGERALGQPDYIAAVEEAGRLGRRLGDPDIVVEAAIASVWPGTFFVSAGRTQTSLVELSEDALELVDADDPRRARVLCTLAAHLTFDADRDRRVGLLGEALEVAQKNGDPELIGSVLVAEYLALWDPTTAARRLEIASEVARLARASGDIDLEFFAGFFAAIGAAERADVGEARRNLQALAGPVTASQNFYFGFLAERLDVSLDVLTCAPGVQGRIDALAARYEGTHADTSGTWALQTGGVARQAGTLGELAPAMRSMVEGSDVGGNWMAPYGLALLDRGDLAAASAVLDDIEEQPLDYFWITTTQIQGELAARLGRRDVAGRIYDLLLPHRHQLGITGSGSLCLGLVATTLGGLALAVGDHEAAIETLAGAVDAADAMGAPFESAMSRRLLVEALVAAGDRAEDVGLLLDEAIELADRHRFAAEQRTLVALRDTCRGLPGPVRATAPDPAT